MGTGEMPRSTHGNAQAGKDSFLLRSAILAFANSETLLGYFPMVANPKWPPPGGDGNETNFRNLLIFLFVVVGLSVLRITFELTNGMGFFSPAQW